MFERIYACLLRLYPPAFRAKYQEEVLQFYRDRLRDSPGIIRRFQLHCELLGDVLVAMPHAWRNTYTTSTPSPVAIADGIPSFRLLDEDPIHPASALIGSMLSFTAISAFGIMLSFPPHSRSSSTSNQTSPVESVMERLNGAMPIGNDDQSAIVIGSSAAGTHGKSQTTHASAAIVVSVSGFDSAERDRVIQATASILLAHYVDPQKAHAASDLLLTRERHGEYDAIGDGATLAERLTEDIQSSTHDPNVAVQFSKNAIPNSPPAPSAAQREEYRAAMMRQNCTVEKVQVLPNNIGYIKFNFFPDPTICSSVFHESLEQLDHSKAIIFDLRDNTGGLPDMVADVAAELFGHPVQWYNPRATPNTSMLSPAPGSKFANKPVYILTSSHTFSGAEHFTYDLKMLKRATVIGETTRGGHPGTVYHIDDHFWMAVPEAREPSPYGTFDWQGTGVQPDVKVNASDALTTAEKLAEKLPN